MFSLLIEGLDTAAALHCISAAFGRIAKAEAEGSMPEQENGKKVAKQLDNAAETSLLSYFLGEA